MDTPKNTPPLDIYSPKENRPLIEPAQQSVPPTESTEQSDTDESEVDVDHDTELSLEKTKNANQALSTIEDSGFFTQSLYTFLVLTSVTEEIGTNLLELLDEKHTHVRKSFYLHKAVLTLKLPSFINSAPHAWFVQQLLQWSFNGQLTQAEARRVRVMASPLVTAQSPGYVGDQKEPDTYITPRDNPATGHPTVVMEVGFGQSYSSLVQAVKFWLEGVGIDVRKVVMIRSPGGRAKSLVQSSSGVGMLQIFDGVVEPGRQGTDRLDFDLTSLRDTIAETGLNTIGLIPAP